MEKNHFSREEAKERIIAASIKQFSEKGFDGTRVNEIAESADVNKALIYYYFENKEAILDQLSKKKYSPDDSRWKASYYERSTSLCQ